VVEAIFQIIFPNLGFFGDNLLTNSTFEIAKYIECFFIFFEIVAHLFYGQILLILYLLNLRSLLFVDCTHLHPFVIEIVTIAMR